MSNCEANLTLISSRLISSWSSRDWFQPIRCVMSGSAQLSGLSILDMNGPQHAVDTLDVLRSISTVLSIIRRVSYTAVWRRLLRN